MINEGGTNEVILRELRFWGVETLQAGYGTLELEADAEAPLKELAAAFPASTARVVAPASAGRRKLRDAREPPALSVDDLASRPGRRAARPREALEALPDRYGSFPRAADPLGRSVSLSPEPDRVVSVLHRRFAFRRASIRPRFSRRVEAGREDEIDSSRRAALERPVDGVPLSRPPFTELLKRVSLAFHPGVPFGPVPTYGGMTTSVLFRRAGIPAYGYSPILMNITDEVRRHGNDERVFLRDYVDGVEIMDQVLKEYAFFPG